MLRFLPKLLNWLYAYKIIVILTIGMTALIGGATYFVVHNAMVVQHPSTAGGQIPNVAGSSSNQIAASSSKPGSTAAAPTTGASTPTTASGGKTVTVKTNTSSSASTPVAAPAATPTPSSGSCFSAPSSCGYPDATNTGVPAGTTLRRVPEDITSGTGWSWDSRGWISASDNAVVENLIVNGNVDVSGSNAIVRNNRILISGDSWAVALRTTANTTVSHNTIGVTGAPRLMVGIKDIYGDSTGSIITANNITNVSTGIQTAEGTLADNYIHDLGMVSGDHINGTTANGGTVPMTIRHNTIFNSFNQTDAISIFQDFGIAANVLITDNYVAGGGYSIYGGGGSYGTATNIRITNNRVSDYYYTNGGYWGWLAHYDYGGTGNVCSGNIMEHTATGKTEALSC